MKLRVSNPGEPMKPIRVLLEKDGKPCGEVTYPAGWTPPDIGESLDFANKKHVVVSGRSGMGDAIHDEIILTIKENPCEESQTNLLQTKPSEAGN